jgi:hypothetical protein
MIESIVIACIAAGSAAAAGGFAHVRRQREQRKAARRSLAEACGLEEIEVANDATTIGRHGQLRVSLSTYTSRNRRGTRVVIEGLDRDIGIRSEGPVEWVAHALGSTDIQVGDRFFDDELVLSGVALVVRALLDGPTRSRLRRVFGARTARVSHGALSVDFDQKFSRRSPLTSEALAELLELAHALEPLPAPEARLAEIARTDELAPVRGRALRALTESVASHPATRGALQAALRDAEPAIRLQAAKALGAEGEPVLQALAADAQADDRVSAEALELLGARFTIERARVALARAVDAGHVRAAVASLRRVATAGAPELAGVAHALERSSGAIAVAATEALATIGVPAAQAPLLEALKSSEDVVAAAAAHALARCGTVGAVPELKDAEQRGGDVRRAARTAIAAIQSRLTGASPGQVSLTGGAAGQLSVVDATDGSVSLPPDEPPR